MSWFKTFVSWSNLQFSCWKRPKIFDTFKRSWWILPDYVPQNHLEIVQNIKLDSSLYIYTASKSQDELGWENFFWEQDSKDCDGNFQLRIELHLVVCWNCLTQVCDDFLSSLPNLVFSVGSLKIGHDGSIYITKNWQMLISPTTLENIYQYTTVKMQQDDHVKFKKSVGWKNGNMIAKVNIKISRDFLSLWFEPVVR